MRISAITVNNSVRTNNSVRSSGVEKQNKLPKAAPAASNQNFKGVTGAIVGASLVNVCTLMAAVMTSSMQYFTEVVIVATGIGALLGSAIENKYDNPNSSDDDSDINY